MMALLARLTCITHAAADVKALLFWRAPAAGTASSYTPSGSISAVMDELISGDS